MITCFIKHKVFYKKSDSYLKSFFNVHMPLKVPWFEVSLGVKGNPTQSELQLPKIEYDKYDKYIAGLSSKTFKELFLPLINLFSKHEHSAGEDESSIRNRRSHINKHLDSDLNDNTEYRERYMKKYMKK